MASFLAGFKAATAKILPAPAPVSEPARADARGLQAKLTAALSDAAPSPDPDADLLALYGRYREARKDMNKVFAERVSSDAEADLILGRCNAMLKDIAKMPARTLRGFGAKMEALRTCECSVLEKICPQEPDAILLQSIVADSYWLFSVEEMTVSEERAEMKPRTTPQPRLDLNGATDPP